MLKINFKHYPEGWEIIHITAPDGTYLEGKFLATNALEITSAWSSNEFSTKIWAEKLFNPEAKLPPNKLDNGNLSVVLEKRSAGWDRLCFRTIADYQFDMKVVSTNPKTIRTIWNAPKAVRIWRERRTG